MSLSDHSYEKFFDKKGELIIEVKEFTFLSMVIEEGKIKCPDILIFLWSVKRTQGIPK